MMQPYPARNTTEPTVRPAPGHGPVVVLIPALRLRSVAQRLALLVGLFIATLSGATIGYVLIEDLGWLDAAYMSVITVSTRRV